MTFTSSHIMLYKYYFIIGVPNSNYIFWLCLVMIGAYVYVCITMITSYLQIKYFNFRVARWD